MIAILKFPKIIKINVTQYEKISLQNKYFTFRFLMIKNC